MDNLCYQDSLYLILQMLPKLVFVYELFSVRNIAPTSETHSWFITYNLFLTKF